MARANRSALGQCCRINCKRAVKAAQVAPCVEAELGIPGSFSRGRDIRLRSIQTPDTFRPGCRAFRAFTLNQRWSVRQRFCKENLITAMNDTESTQPTQSSDWHPADVLAALKKRGHTLAGLSVANGYHPTAAGKALKRAWPAMEAIIAAALGIAPPMIWPSRYDASGQPHSERVRR